MKFNITQFCIGFLLVTSYSESFTFRERISIFAGPAGGHPAVTQSLIKGLEKLNIPFDYNNYVTPAALVIVLADTDDLKRAIILKRQQKIKVLLAGPNLVVRSNEYNGLLGSPEIDVCIVPSDWVRIAYEEDMPSLKGRIAPWFAGIDVHYWQPYSSFQKNRVLVYWKTESSFFCEQVEEKLKEKGFVPFRIQYGKYSKEQFKYYLDQAIFAVFISRSESQGIALAEAWSMNVPTLVFNPGNLLLKGKQYTVVSSCPLLTSATGKTWKNIEELEKLLVTYLLYANEFTPRAWALEQITYSASAQCLIDIIQKI